MEQEKRMDQAMACNDPVGCDPHFGRRGAAGSMRSSCGKQRSAGFSLVQLLGVLAVITLLASALVPSVIRSIDHAAWTKEVNDMSAISNALTLEIVRTHNIPDQFGWTAAVADWTTRPVLQISANPRGVNRQFVYEQGAWLDGKVSWTQDRSGTGQAVPSNVRIALVSAIVTRPAMPSISGSLSTANFNSIWNALQGTTPAYLTAQGWNGNPYDLVIQRVSLDSLFHHLILNTRDNSAAGGYSINSSAYGAVLTGPSGVNTYYLDGTVVGLATMLPNGTLTNELRLALTRDMSFTFESGIWQPGGLTGGGTDNSSTGQSFANQAATFISTSGIAGQHQGADTQGVLSSFYSFMYAYTLWANKCPHFQYFGNPTADADYQILDKLAQNNGIIDSAAGSQNGLLK